MKQILTKPKRMFNPNSLTPEEKRDAFAGVRDENMIGGSYAPSIMGVGFGSPLYAFCRLKRLTKGSDSDGIWLGRELEPYMRKQIPNLLRGFSENIKVRSDPFLYQAGQYPWMIGQMDGVISMGRFPGKRGGVEIKLRGQYDAQKWKGGKTPENVIMQVAHYMAVFPVDYFLVMVMLGWSGNYRIFHREELSDTIESVIESERIFRENHLIPNEMPDATGTDADYAILKEIHGINVIKDGIKMDHMAETIEEFARLKKEISRMTKEMKAEKNKIIAAMEGHQTGICNGRPVCKFTKVKQTRLNTQMIKDAGLYEEYSVDSEYDRFGLIKDR